MKIFKKIDSLLVFLMLSVLCLYAFVGDIDYFFRTKNNAIYKSFNQPNEVYQYPKQGKGINDIKLVKYNPKFNLKISTNGGKNWRDYKHQNLAEIKLNDLTKFPTSIRYKHPFGEFPEVISFLVKAKHQSKAIYVQPKQLTYFKNYQSKLPVVSLIINEKDLFDTYKGMFILGANSWIENDNKFYKPFWDRNANYKQRKGEWNKKAYFQYYEQGNLKNTLICDVAISGNATRAFSQKSLKLKSNKIYSNEKFEYPFFGADGLAKYKSILLRQSGNDNKKTLFADLLMQSLIINDNVLTQKGRAVNVFINGNYWGIYNLRERYETYFIAKKEKVNKSKVTILEGSAALLKAGKTKAQNKYKNTIDSLFNLDEVSNSTINFINDFVSLKSFKDYIFYETFFGNKDWLKSNTMWYKADHKKWKWLLNDLDYALAYLGIENVNSNYFNLLKQSESYTSKLFNILIKNKAFKKEFKNTLQDNLIQMYQNKRVSKIFHQLKSNLQNDIHWQSHRWRSNFSVEEWEKNCQLNLNFLEQRQNIYKKQIQDL